MAARSNADANPDLLSLSVNGWYYEEKEWYNYKDNTCSPPQSWQSCGHYTQVSSYKCKYETQSLHFLITLSNSTIHHH